VVPNTVSQSLMGPQTQVPIKPRARRFVIVVFADCRDLTLKLTWKKRAKRSKSGAKRTIELSGDESDGKSALRAVEEKECAREYSGRRGPIGKTRKHWYEPKAIVEPGREPNRWQFKCKYCSA
jgi:hypothetical protein